MTKPFYCEDTAKKALPKMKAKSEKRHIYYSCVNCPWYKKSESYSEGYEQGKKEQADLDVKLACDSDTSLIKIVSNKIRKQTLSEVLKEFSERDKEGEIVDTCEYMPYKKVKFQKWLEQKIKEAG